MGYSKNTQQEKIIDNYKPVESRTNKNYEQEEDMSKKGSKRAVKEVLCKETVNKCT